MIAPARVAAYDILRAVSAGRADLPVGDRARRARTLPRRARPRAGHRDRHRRPALARGARPSDRRTSRRRRSSGSTREIVEILRLSTYQLLYLTRVPAAAVVDDAVSLARRAGKKSAAASSTPCCAPSRAKPLAAAAAVAARRSDAIARRRSTTSASRCRIRAGWPRAGSTGSGSTAAEAWMRFNNPPAPLTLRANRLRTTPEQLCGAAGALRTCATAPGRFAPDALLVDAGHPLRATGASVRGCSSSRTKRRSSWRCSPARDPGPLRARHLRVARRQDDCPRGAMRDEDASSPATSATRRMRLLAERVTAPARPTCGSCRPTCSQPLPFSPLFDTRHRRCAVLGPRHAAARSGHPVAPSGRSDLAVLAGQQLRMLDHAARSSRRRPARLRDVLERAGRERGRRRGLSARDRRRSRRSMRDGRILRLPRTSSTSAATCAPRPHATASKPSSAPCFERRSRDGRCSVQSSRRFVRWPFRGPASGARASCSCSAARWSATYVLFAAASMRIALRAREVQVPDLTNRTAERSDRASPASSA